MKTILVGGAGSRIFFDTENNFQNMRIFSRKISGIELFLGKHNHISSLFESKALVRSLMQFKELSIHAPFNEGLYSDDSSTFERLSDLKKLYKLCRAKRIVFHPTDFLDLSVLDDLGMNILVENMDFRKDRFIRWQEFTDIFKKHDFGLCLDIAHASSISYKTLDDFLFKLSERIEELHVSHLVNGKHSPLHLLGEAELKHLKFLSDIDKPLVIENRDIEISLIEKEVEFLKKF